MTGKKRFGNFVVQGAEGAAERGKETAATALAAVTAGSLDPQPPPLPPSFIPPAPAREERRPFSTRVKPSVKGHLDAYVMGLKQAGWPVSQEAVLEELLLALKEDDALRARITSRLARV